MTSAVIDALRFPGDGGRMTRDVPVRFDATLRVVIAADAFLSAMAAMAGVAGPVVALLPMTSSSGTVVGLVALGAALLLAALGAVTAVLLALRMRAGHDAVPRGLRLPLPAAMVPDLGAGTGRQPLSAPGTSPSASATATGLT